MSPSCEVPQWWVDVERQEQRRSAGTEAMTSSACMPQPVQVTFPQAPHFVGLHMSFSFVIHYVITL